MQSKTLLSIVIVSLSMASTLFSQTSTITCYDTPDGTSATWGNWEYKDVYVQSGYKIDSVIGYFQRPGYPEASKDYIFSVDLDTNIYDNGDSSPWIYSNVDSSLYNYWIDLSSYDYFGECVARVGIPSTAGAVWDSVCVSISQFCDTVVEIFDTTYITEFDTVIIDIYDTITTEVYDTTIINDTITTEVFDTTIITETVYDTTMVTIHDTLITEVFDTTTTTEYDTVITEIFDTTIVTINDTIITEFFDTTVVSVYDTSYISVTDTLIIDVTIEGLTPPDNINTLKVYPNPTNSIIHIHTGNYINMNDYTILITNTLGQTVFENLCNQQVFSIDISTFGAEGLYFISILDGNSTIVDTRKIILE